MTAQETHYDAIVIGAGIEGSATALQLRQKGVETLLLEQFPLPHSRGSSHGQSRVIRKSYPEEFYCEMMNYCVDVWHSVQEKTGLDIYKQIGYLAIGEQNGRFLKDTVDAMTQHGADFDELTPAQFAAQYPMLSYADTIAGVLDPNGGVLMADKALYAFQSLFRTHGGHLKDNEKVISLVPGQKVKVMTNKSVYTCQSVVLCCGPWTNALLKPLNLKLPLQPIRVSVCYWPEKEPGSHAPDKLPTFFQETCCGGHSIFGLPSQEYPGHVKLCLHSGPDIDPESRDSVDTEWIEHLVRSYVTKHFPGLENKPSLVESCIYTNTPDRHFILDRHPVWSNVIIGAGFSGHGFKLAPAVGLILCQLALGLTPSYDISHFRIDRFPRLEASQAKL